MMEPADILDDVLAGRRAPDPESAALMDALAALTPLRVMPARPPAAAHAGLQAFLSDAQAARTARGKSAVSSAPKARPTGWQLTFFHKELTPMNIVLTLALAVSLALGGTGATVYAARDSLPNDPLYGVKLAAEDWRLGMTTDSQAQLAMLRDLTQTRTREMLQLAEAGQAVPTAVTTRLQTQLRTELQLAAALEDPQLTVALAQVQQQAQTQLQTLTQARQAAPADAGLQAAEQALLQTHKFAQLGQTSPAQFRTQLRAGAADPANTPAPMRTPSGTPQQAGYGPGDGVCPTGTCTPEYDGNNYGAGPGNPAVTPSGDHNAFGARSGTPNPLSTPNAAGYGPGNGACVEGACTPEYDGNRYGPGAPDPAATPAGDQNSYGPGPVQSAPDPAATPAGDQNSYGPGPVAPTPAGDGAGSPGPLNPPAPEATCTPAGDQNSYGPGPAQGAPDPAATPAGDGSGANPPPAQPGQNQP